MSDILSELCDQGAFFKCALYDSRGSFEIPEEIMNAATLLTKWAEENNMKEWRLNGVASREQLETLELQLKHKWAEPAKWDGFIYGPDE